MDHNCVTDTAGRDARERAAHAAALGLRQAPGQGAVAELEGLAGDPDPRVRAAAVGALVRLGGPTAGAAWARAVADPDAAVRRRACELAPAVRPDDASGLLGALDDPDTTVAEAAAFGLGELGATAVAAGAVDRLAIAARGHADPLVREAAVAALGALGEAAGLAAVLAACRDRPAVRRRAVLALAAFEGPEVDAALERALTDRDWQVRQAAEDLRSP